MEQVELPEVDGQWQTMAAGSMSSSSSDDEGSTPYEGYEALSDEPRDAAPQGEAGEEGEASWPAPTMPLSSKFLPRGVPTSVLASPVVVTEAEGGAGFSARFAEIDFAEVRRVASGITLGKKK